MPTFRIKTLKKRCSEQLGHISNSWKSSNQFYSFFFVFLELEIQKTTNGRITQRHDDSWKRNSNLEEYVTNEREGAGIGKLICSLRGGGRGKFQCWRTREISKKDRQRVRYGVLCVLADWNYAANFGPLKELGWNAALEDALLDEYIYPLCRCVQVFIYIYIYTEREREFCPRRISKSRIRSLQC